MLDRQSNRKPLNFDQPNYPIIYARTLYHINPAAPARAHARSTQQWVLVWSFWKTDNINKRTYQSSVYLLYYDCLFVCFRFLHISPFRSAVLEFDCLRALNFCKNRLMIPQASMRIFDAHCHLQDNRIYSDVHKLIRKATEVGVQRFTVNGIFEGDWHLVKQMADEYPSIVPSFGLHPWYVGERSPNWFENLKGYIDTTPSAAVGEIGLDRGSYGRIVDFETQVDVFQKQLELAKEVKRPVSIHCVNAFGRLVEILQRVGPFPEAVVLHSYVGSSEMVSALAKLGCYFSFSGHITSHSHAKAKKTVNSVPIDKMLLETDAPDGLPKFDNSMRSLLHVVRRNPHASQNDLQNHSQSEDTTDATSEQSLPEEKLNHPANIRAILTYIADLREMPEVELAEICYKNAVRVFSYEGSKISSL